MRRRSPPDFDLETEAGALRGALVVGVDEVGRGPLAGPVTAGAAWLDPAALSDRILATLGDSKALTAGARTRALEAAAPCATLAIAEAGVAEIDHLNILQAALLAMRRAVDKLVGRIGRPPDLVLVDGNRAPDWPYTTRTVVRGDATCASIAVAAIAAKQARDAEMARLAARFPEYGWERNAGYGTAAHLAALADHGVTVHHRRSFAPVRRRLDPGPDPGG